MEKKSSLIGVIKLNIQGELLLLVEMLKMIFEYQKLQKTLIYYFIP